MKLSAIEEIIATGESDHLEFKTPSANPDSVGTAVCAFLNSRGGTVVIGVDDSGKLQPLANANAMVEGLRQRLASVLLPKAMWSVVVDSTDAGDVISVEVPSGKDLPYVFNGDIYVRKGAKTVLADAETIRGLVQRRYTEPVRWERLPAPGLTMEDLDLKQIETLVDLAQKSRNYAFKNAEDTASVLEDLALREKTGELTNGAAVLFGLNPSRRFPQTRVRVAAYSTNKGGDFLEDRILEGNLFSLFEEAFSIIRQYVSIEGKFKSGTAERQVKPQYPYNALREGLINALAHRDYASFSGGISIGIYPNRLEIWNSGRLPEGLTVADLKKTHQSIPPNPDILHALYLRVLLERVGRGTQKILDDCLRHELPAPEWKTTTAGITLIFQTKQGKREGKKLNLRQRTLLERLKAGVSIKPSDYYAETAGRVSQRQAQRDLTDLEAGGWFKREGDGPATVYVRTEKPID